MWRTRGLFAGFGLRARRLCFWGAGFFCSLRDHVVSPLSGDFRVTTWITLIAKESKLILRES